MARRWSHVAGFDDAPFPRSHRGDVLVVGAVYAGRCLAGVLSGAVRRDGRNSTAVLVRLVGESRFRPHLHAVLLQGIAFAGFNVVDLRALHEALRLPVLVVARRRPDLAAIRRALLLRVGGGKRKWSLIQDAGPMEPVAGLHVQRAGLSLEEAAALIRATTWNGALPEPLRTAHLIAGGIATGESRHRA